MLWYYGMLLTGGWMLLLWFIQNIIHEESHALAGYIFGWHVDKRFWWFHRRESDGKRFFARIVWRNPVKMISDGKKALIYLAPIITNSLLVLLTITLLLCVEMWEHIAYPVSALMLLNLIDGGNNCRIALVAEDEDKDGFLDGNGDMLKFAKRTKSGRIATRAMTGSWIAIVAIIVTLTLIFK